MTNWIERSSVRVNGKQHHKPEFDREPGFLGGAASSKPATWHCHFSPTTSTSSFFHCSLFYKTRNRNSTRMIQAHFTTTHLTPRTTTEQISIKVIYSPGIKTVQETVGCICRTPKPSRAPGLFCCAARWTEWTSLLLQETLTHCAQHL